MHPELNVVLKILIFRHIQLCCGVTLPPTFFFLSGKSIQSVSQGSITNEPGVTEQRSILHERDRKWRGKKGAGWRGELSASHTHKTHTRDGSLLWWSLMLSGGWSQWSDG